MKGKEEGVRMINMKEKEKKSYQSYVHERKEKYEGVRMRKKEMKGKDEQVRMRKK